MVPHTRFRPPIHQVFRNLRVHPSTLAALLLFSCLPAVGCGPKGGGTGNGGQCSNGVLEEGEVCDGTDLGTARCEDNPLYTGGTLGCSQDCQTYDTSQCISVTCGNGVLDQSEVCDGANLDGMTCQGLSYQSGTLACSNSCQYDVSGCFTCGNGVIEGPESCDGPQFGGASCQTEGHSGGQLVCRTDCTIDVSGCFDCGDSVCDGAKGEDQTNCLQDCGWLFLSAGSYHTCGITVDGSAWCWGAGSQGQLGNGDTADATRPVRVSNLAGVTQIAAGGFHTCAMTGTGSVMCWGSNSRGQLGNGTQNPSSTPTAVSNASGVQSISAGAEHTCAVKTGGQVYCWGYNGFGQLGDGLTADQPTMVQAGSLSGVTAVSAGVNHTCAVTSSGAAWCWGRNVNGEVGDGTAPNNQPSPVQVSGLSGGSMISAGKSYHTCAVTGSGALCWGANGHGQLGNNTTNESSTPVSVLFGGTPDHVSAGHEHTCGVGSNFALWCWGANTRGELGDGTTQDRLVPTSVTGLTGNVERVTAGSEHTCALMDDGRAYCWGGNSAGQLGDGTTSDRHQPVAVSN